MLKILLVEDNLLNQKFAAAVVKKLGHQVVVAENGQIGLDLYLNEHFDLVLMDIQMPVMNGIEATKAIRKIEKEAGDDRHIPIIGITAYVIYHDRKNCLEAGMDEFMAKPYKPVQLEEKIRIFYPDMV